MYFGCTRYLPIYRSAVVLLKYADKSKIDEPIGGLNQARRAQPNGPIPPLLAQEATNLDTIDRSRDDPDTSTRTKCQFGAHSFLGARWRLFQDIFPNYSVPSSWLAFPWSNYIIIQRFNSVTVYYYAT